MGDGVPTPLLAATGSAEATRALAAAVASCCRPGDVVLLAGELGAGKTTFAQGVGRALGIVEPVTSPTFTLVRQYEVGQGHGGVRTLLHADVYRLGHLQEVADLGLGELVEDGAVALVEWGDAAEPVLGRDALTVAVAAGPGDDDRTFVLSASGGSWAGRWEALAAELAPWRV